MQKIGGDNRDEQSVYEKMFNLMNSHGNVI